jgi:hypothetical protein
MEEPAQHKWEFLKCGDYNLRAVNQGFRELPGILVYRFDHALCVLDLVDGILQLLIEHAAVGDDDNAVKDLLILAVVQTGEPVRQPVKGSVLTIDNHRLLGWFSIENGSVLGFGNSLLNRHSFQVLCAPPDAI